MNEGALCKKEKEKKRQFLWVGGREDLATVDGKLDWEIKLVAGGTDQLDND